MNTILIAAAQIALALIAGAATAYQPGLNARFASHAGAAVWGGVVNFCIGLLAVLGAAAFMRPGLPQTGELTRGPWWMWMGGFCGGYFVIMALVLVPRMGAATYLGCMIAGQLLASVIIDHFGHMGLPLREVTPARIGGVVLVLGGVALIRWG